MSFLRTKVSRNIGKKFTGLFLAGIACAALPAAAVEAGVIVAVSGPSAATYPVGKKVSNSEAITLKSGDVVTVLDGGNTRVLRGAGKFTLGSRRSAQSRSAFSALTRQRSAQRVRTGAVRNAGSAAMVTRPNLWYVDVAQSGTHCLASDKNVRLWRPTTVGDISYDISADDEGQSVTFDDGGMIAPWDLAVMPLTSGTSYVIGASSGEGVDEGVSSLPATVRLVVLDEVSSNPEELADKLIVNGCFAQLELITSATLVAED